MYFWSRTFVLRSYLQGRSQCVQIDGITSEFAELTCGVPQGSVLGPSKFFICMYPIGLILKHHGINYYIYADGTQLYISFDGPDPSVAIDKINTCLSDNCKDLGDSKYTDTDLSLF